MSNTLTDEQIDSLLDADEEENSKNTLAIFTRIHERRRKRAHAKAKSEQPTLGIRLAESTDLSLIADEASPQSPIETLAAFARSPLTEDDAAPGGMDYLCQTVQDCFEDGELEDAIFAAFRVWRKAWAWNRHLGPIGGEVNA